MQTLLNLVIRSEAAKTSVATRPRPVAVSASGRRLRPECAYGRHSAQSRGFSKPDVQPEGRLYASCGIAVAPDANGKPSIGRAIFQACAPEVLVVSVGGHRGPAGMLSSELASQKPPLHKFAVCDSRKVDDWAEAALPIFGPTQVQPKGDAAAFRARINLCPLPRTALCYGRFGGAFSVSVPESVSFVQGMPIRGVGEHVNNGMKIPYSPSKGSVGAPGVLSLCYEADLEILAVFMKPDALHNTLSGLIGAPVGKKLELDRSNYDGRPEPRAVRSLANLMVTELDHEEDLSPLVLAELEQAMLVAFLTGAGHNYAHLLDGCPPGLAPPQVRLVEEYIEAHWNQPVSIEGLAVVANASARSVFHAFKEFRGYSPMSFLKRERLRHAKKMLANPTSNESVTNVTFACGFGNMGRFADDYQKAYGELPSETLNRARGVKFDRDKTRPHRLIPARAK